MERAGTNMQRSIQIVKKFRNDAIQIRKKEECLRARQGIVK